MKCLRPDFPEFCVCEQDGGNITIALLLFHAFQDGFFLGDANSRYCSLPISIRMPCQHVDMFSFNFFLRLDLQFQQLWMTRLLDVVYS